MKEKRLIDANALMAYFEEQYNLAMADPDPVSGYVMAALRCCKDYFKTIPTVDAVEVVHGRWVEFNTFMTCSVCDKDFYYADNNCDEFDYCPNCGAKMDGGNEDG